MAIAPPPPPNAADLKRLCADYGIRPNKGRGQNFMVDPRALHLIRDAAEVAENDVVLEPGPGPGGLTGLLAERAAAVVAVEIDNRLHELLTDRLGATPNLRIVHGDALAKGDRLNLEAMGKVREAVGAAPDRTFKLVSNLPYRVSTAILSAALFNTPCPERVVVTVQKEVADRLRARPGSGDYGYLSVMTQAVARVTALRTLRPSAFWPQPEIDSAVVEVRPDDALRAQAGDLAALQRTVSGAFLHRRKQLARGLVMAGLAPDRAAALETLAQCGIDGGTRAEDLDVPSFVQLAALLP